MRKTTTFIFLMIFSFMVSLAQAQISEHTSWTVTPSQKEAKIGDQIDLIFTVSIDADWYLYSSDFDPDLGPQVTTIELSPNASFKKIGPLKAVNASKKHDDVFDGEVKYFKKNGTFRQTVQVLSKDFKVEGLVDFQVCSDASGLCQPGDYEFEVANVTIQALKAKAVEDQPKSVKEDPKDTKEETKENNPTKSSTDTEAKDVPMEDKQDTATKSTAQSTTSQSESNTTQIADDFEKEHNQSSTSLWGFLAIAFGGGLIALLTPCVYPMIPMTVSFFMKGEGFPPADETPEQAKIRTQTNRRKGIIKAMVYGLSIIGIYALLGLVVSLVFGIEATNFLSTHWLPNIIFFLTFVVFAASFLGMFELVLPTSFVNKMDQKADKGGYGGIFFMAFTLVLVSFSCTAPIAGSLILASINGEILRPVLGMVAFSAAFALPFVIFAMFPSLLNNMPKSGGWLNAVKVVLGFVELALAFKFLSTADLSYHWGLLDRDVFIGIWIAIFFMLGLYLIGKLTLPHDSKMEKVSVPRLMLGITTFSFVVYLVPGLFGADLKALAGIIPPKTTHNFDVVQIISDKIDQGGVKGAKDDALSKENIKYADFLHLPYGLKGFFDYEQGLAYAKKVNKPIFLDFTGHGCANCRKMEDYVWKDPRILSMLREDYVIISLYVDDKTTLPESEWYTSKSGKVKKTLGKKNLHIQRDKFNAIAQPYYVLMDTDEKQLVNTEMGYDADKDKFYLFLKAGLERFKK